MKPRFNPSSLRKTVIEMAYAGNAVHLGCAFSIVELLSCLYRRHMRYDEGNPDHSQRDYLVLSKGHGVMAQYACLYELGWLTRADIDNYFHDGSRLKGLSDAHVPGCEVTSGTLGHGLSVGVGLALAAQRKKSGQKCYVIIGDGEINEGPIWEAMLFAAHAQLDNLMVIVDANGFQAMGTTDEVMKLGDLSAKFAAFDFDVLSVNGHDMDAISNAIDALESRKNGYPKALIAATVKGKGVSYMENVNAWHYSRLNPELYAQAMTELEGASE
ncbi:transketolase subunit A [Variovorax sp. HW608]|uniref:transketolase n=1 Tax=Variovorax sp. HW608 TaxID=1034889 RepID=UPI00081FA477|nr:transketolase [Variovorax sp. HW608]SCK37695.1 transketolase subunit A [Variovorax sp. HW608]